jgi:predicted LPLAT superfamily acyltransferase
MIAHSTSKAGWAERGERGSPFLIRFMAWLSFTLGRGPSRLLLRAIMVYFVTFSGAARRSARDFLARALGRSPTWADLYRLFFHFGAGLHDRIFFLRGRFDLFDVEVHGAEQFGPGGVLLMGAHLGSFEALRACGHVIGKRRVVMAMYEENARKINAVLAAVAPDAQQDIVALGHVQSMIELSGRLEAGAYVGILADRTLGDEATLRVDFLGRPAPFPTGPMRMAAALRQPVFFMAGLYRGGNRYEIHFEPIADFSNLEGASRAERDARVEAGVRAYAQCLERFARRAPYDWFNFHDFWGSGS